MENSFNNIKQSVKKVCFYADSITNGNSFIKEIAQHYLNFEKNDRYEFHNVGISGHTVAGGV